MSADDVGADDAALRAHDHAAIRAALSASAEPEGGEDRG